MILHYCPNSSKYNSILLQNPPKSGICKVLQKTNSSQSDNLQVKSPHIVNQKIDTLKIINYEAKFKLLLIF